MNKKSVKVFFAIVALLIIASFSSSVLAYSPNQFEGNRSGDTYANVQSGGNIVIGIVQAIGITVAIIMLIMVAIKYVSAAPEGKAEVKKSVIIYVVGAILLFASAGVLELVQNFADEIV